MGENLNYSVGDLNMISEATACSTLASICSQEFLSASASTASHVEEEGARDEDVAAVFSGRR